MRRAAPTPFMLNVKKASAATQNAIKNMSSIAICACTNTIASKKVMAHVHSAWRRSASSANDHSPIATIVIAPNSALIARHPKGLSPNSQRLTPINSFASGGCSWCSIWPDWSQVRAVGTYQVSSK